MSGWLLIMAMVAAVNPWRTRVGLGTARYPASAVGVGVLTALGGVALLGVVSAPLLESLQITPETYLIAAGLVAIIAGARTLFFPEPFPEPALRGWRSGLWPLAFPRLLSPEVIALSLAIPGQRGSGWMVAAAAIGVVAAGLLALWGSDGTARRLHTALGAVAGAVLVVAGIWMMIEGIRDV